ncbi:FAD-dependent monooxygenase [Pseudonocardia sp.]|uniref:FAD-dependent monooxygenase n=1 Tax=Pseudonocardia sp. TaxID=60912 RepID=UPI00260310BB|nr:FAD-dependent monooxygenase [Pseudonocardia sp.]MCW2721622.1 monooxygenase, FAD-binding [Pseudonocardia sp.]
MRIVCVGGGPAGLYFAISAKLRDSAHDITVIERDPPGATYGWGVVYWDNLLDSLYSNDRESARQLRAASALWQEQQFRLCSEQTAYLPGYGYSLGRASMLDILARRAIGLGVDVQYRRDVDDLSVFADADLVVACDGANSRVRQLHGDHFGTTVDTGNNPYIWLGTDKVFDSFVFAFEETPAGWVWFHAYPSSAGISTCIVECTAQTWRGLGLDSLDVEDGVRMLEKIFSTALDGHSLINQSRGVPGRWLRFTQVNNEVWYHDRVVLVGDAAHTTHFTIGSGTRLAILDAIALAQSLYEHPDVPVALQRYDLERREGIREAQAAARSSMAWFEQIDRYTDRDAVEFCFAMAGRGGALRPWRYQRHLANQVPVLRRARRIAHTGRRWYRARRRGEPSSRAVYGMPQRPVLAPVPGNGRTATDRPVAERARPRD